MPRNWQVIVDDLTDIGKKVHLSMRQDPFDVERIQAELFRDRRRYYELELTDQARRVGCGMMTGRLTNQAVLDELRAASERDATSIVNTYNADLASAIRYIRAETPTANRYVYAKRLGEWEQNRAAWKNDQIAQYTEMSARAKAQQDFFAKNSVHEGVATLEPKRAVCPVCQGWVARGEVPITVAKNNPPPYHPNCFPPDAMVTLPDGSLQQIDQIQEGQAVASRQGRTQVVQVFQRHTTEDLYHLSVGGQEIRLTGDHPVLTAHGWQPARELQVGDSVVLVHFHESDLDDK